MIKNRTPLSIAESQEFVDKKKKETLAFIKKFSKLKPEKAKELRERIEKLDLIKLDENSISKIIDVFPEDGEELNKVFPGMSFDEEESKKILELVKEYK